ncbi:MAG: PP2C family protein-serine/threonine phosphatase [Microbacteriaceae bacterium]
MATHSSAASDVGLVRQSNQDSGFAGRFLMVVADGMGGHAGGDVASHVVIRQLLELDRPFDSPEKARKHLKDELLKINALLIGAVVERPELAGLGTTVSALLRVGNKAVIAHIGDSRIYRLREGKLEQVTEDHTYVQRLVDSGRISEEEALVHPRRSVLLRVLGDVDTRPDIDTMILPISPGDRWMLCSDGLCGVVRPEEIRISLTKNRSTTDAAASLVAASMRLGAPDNVTVVVMDDRDDPAVESVRLVGAAAKPISVSADTPAPRAQRRPGRRMPVITSDIPVVTSEQARPVVRARVDKSARERFSAILARWFGENGDSQK